MKRLLVEEDGVALIEFAMVLPMMLFVFAVIVEGSRMMLAYEAAVAGVRDATRYLSRAAIVNICSTGGSVSGYSSELKTIVTNAATAKSVFGSGVTVNSVTPGYNCVTGTYRSSPIAILQVSANVTITFPFSGLFTLVGQSRPSVTTTVTDEARVYGS